MPPNGPEPGLGRVPAGGGTLTDTALLAVSISLTVTAVCELKSESKAAALVLPNLVVGVIAAVMIPPPSGRVTEMEPDEIAVSGPLTSIMVSKPPAFCFMTVSE